MRKSKFTFTLLAFFLAMGVMWAQKADKPDPKPTLQGFEAYRIVDMNKGVTADYTYTVPDIGVGAGSYSMIYDSIIVADVATVGSVTVLFDWTTDSWPSEGSFTVTSPTGTEGTIAAGITGGTYSVDLTDFNGEDLAGTWYFTIYDSYGDGGHSASNITFEVNEASNDPILGLNADMWDFGMVTVGFTGEVTGFTITNIGGGTLTISNVTDLSGTEFTTDFAQWDTLALEPGETSGTFGFTYNPVDDVADSVEFYIYSNAGAGLDTITLMGVGEMLPDDMVQIGAQMYTNSGLPMEPYYGYTYSQQIYLQSELAMTDMRITSVQYQYNGNSDWTEDNIKIYMGHTALTELYSYIPGEDLMLVYDGPFTVPAEEGWVEIPLQVPFVFNNMDNLVVGFIANTAGYSSGSDEFYAHEAPNFDEDTMAIIARNDGSPYDAYAPPATWNYSWPYRSNIRLQFGAMPTGPEISLSAEVMDFGLLEAGDMIGMPVMINNTGVADLIVDYATVAAPFSCDFSGTIAPGDFAEVMVYFEPTEAGDFMETCTFDIVGDFDGVNTVDLMGSAYPMGALFEDFEGDVFPPMGWTSMLGQWGFGSAPASGESNAYLSYGEEDTLVTPALDIVAGDMLSFWAHNSSYSGGELYVLYSADMMTWTVLDTCFLTADYTEYVFDLSDAAGTSYIGFYGVAYVYLDFVLGPMINIPEEPPLATANPWPENMSVDVPVETMFGWDEVMFADGYLLYLGFDSVFTVDEIVYDGPDNWFYPEMPLSYETNYHWMVVPYNMYGDAVDNMTWTFTTGENPAGYLFWEDFEDISEWTIVDAEDNTAAVTWTNTDPGGNFFNNAVGAFLSIDSDEAGSGSVITHSTIYSPVIDCSAEDNLYLMFTNYYNNIGADEGFIYVIAGGDTTMVAYFNADTENGEEMAINISSLADGQSDVQIAFEYNDNSSWAWYWLIDNLRVTHVDFGYVAGNVVVNGQEDNSGAEIYMDGMLAFTTDATGDYVIGAIPGEHNVMYWHPMASPFGVDLFLEEFDTVWIDLALGPYAPTNLMAESSLNGIVPLMWTEPYIPLAGELAWDDGTFEFGFGIGDGFAGYGIVNTFIPNQYPYNLSHVGLNMSESYGTIQIVVYGVDENNEPTGDPLYISEAVEYTFDEWVNYELDEPIVIEEGMFAAGWLQGSDPVVYINLDQDSDLEHTWTNYDGLTTWVHPSVYGTQFAGNAAVRAYDDSQTKDVVTSVKLKSGVYNAPASLRIETPTLVGHETSVVSNLTNSKEVDNYNVYWAEEGPDAEWTMIDGIMETEYTVTDLPNDIGYMFYVTSVVGGVESSPSNIAYAMPKTPRYITGNATIVDKTDHSGIMVTAYGMSGEFMTETDADGNYSLELPGDWYDVGFSYGLYEPVYYGYVDATEDIVLEDVVIRRYGPTDLMAESYHNAEVPVSWVAPFVGFYEGFENGLPESWTFIDNDGDGNNWFEYTYVPHTGYYSAASASWIGGEILTPDNWMITPEVVVEATSELKFWAAAQDPAYPSDHYKVKLSTTGTAVEDFTVTLFEETLADDVWHEVVIDLSEYAGQGIHIAFQHTESTDWFYMKIDDVLITDVDKKSANYISYQEPAPTYLNESNVGEFMRLENRTQEEIDAVIDAHSVTYDIPKATLDGFNLYYRMVGEDTWMVIEEIAPEVTEYLVEDLTNDVQYEFMVTAIISGYESNPSNMAYAMPVTPGVLMGTAVAEGQPDNSGMMITLYGMSGVYMAEADVDGNFSIEVPNDYYDIEFMYPGYLPVYLEYIFVAIDTTVVDIVLFPNPPSNFWGSAWDASINFTWTPPYIPIPPLPGELLWDDGTFEFGFGIGDGFAGYGIVNTFLPNQYPYNLSHVGMNMSESYGTIQVVVYAVNEYGEPTGDPLYISEAVEYPFDVWVNFELDEPLVIEEGWFAAGWLQASDPVVYVNLDQDSDVGQTWTNYDGLTTWVHPSVYGTQFAGNAAVRAYDDSQTKDIVDAIQLTAGTYTAPEIPEKLPNSLVGFKKKVDLGNISKVAEITGYNLYYREAWTEDDYTMIEIVDPEAVEYMLDGLTNGIEYEAYITAVEDIEGNVVESAPSEMTYAMPFDPYSDILVFDYDGGGNNWDGDGIIAALQTLYPDAYILVMDPMTFVEGLPFPTMNKVFVTCGMYSYHNPIQTGSIEETWLIDYLMAGTVEAPNNLYYAGGDIFAFSPADNLLPYLGIIPEADGSGDLYDIAGLSWPFVDYTSAYVGDNNWVDHIAAANAYAVDVLTNPTVGYTCGVIADFATYRVMSATFEASGTDDPVAFFTNVNEFFDNGLPMGDAEITVDVVGLDDDSGVTVTIEGLGSMMTDEDGVAMFVGIPEGIYNVTAVLAGFMPDDGEITIVADEVATLSLSVAEDIQPVTNVQGDQYADGEMTLSWEHGAAGDLIELSQHTGDPANAYYQSWGMGYGVVYDLSGYSNVTLENLDFHHSSYGLTGTWEYNLHIVDWETYDVLAVVGPLSTTGDDIWEEAIDLGSIVGNTNEVAVLLEPLGNAADDAYPDLSGDGALDGYSILGDLTDFAGFSLVSASVGDFLMDLWIMASGKSEPVAARKITRDEAINGMSRNGYAPGQAGTFTVEQNTNKGFVQFHIYMDGAEYDVTTEDHMDMVMTPADVGMHTFGVMAEYLTGNSATVEIEVEVMNWDASLSDLTVDGTTVSGFDPGTYSYDVMVAAGTETVTIGATATDASATLDFDATLTVPGTAEIEVMAADGMTMLTYEVEVDKEPFTGTDFLTYSIDGTAGVIDASAHTITVDLSGKTMYTPVFTLSDGATAYIGTTEQVSGTTQVDFTSGVAVTYTVVAENGDDQDWAVTVTTGVGELDINSLVAYPNPVKEVLTITNINGLDRIVMSDVIGNDVITIEDPESTEEINVSKLEDGIYLIRYFGENGEQRAERIIKH